jgi:hypothetical protein
MIEGAGLAFELTKANLSIGFSMANASAAIFSGYVRHTDSGIFTHGRLLIVGISWTESALKTGPDATTTGADGVLTTA